MFHSKTKLTFFRVCIIVLNTHHIWSVDSAVGTSILKIKYEVSKIITYSLLKHAYLVLPRILCSSKIILDTTYLDTYFSNFLHHILVLNSLIFSIYILQDQTVHLPIIRHYSQNWQPKIYDCKNIRRIYF